MSSAITTQTKRVSVSQLRRDGFTASQVRQLTALRASYPIRELVSSEQELRKLELLRWMRQNGRLDD